MSDSASPEIRQIVDHLFRQQAGQMVATLTRVLGTEQLELAEASVQEALIKAMQTWPFQGIPENPAGWIVQVAKNQALDHLRREQRTRTDDPDALESLEDAGEALGRAHDAEFSPLLRDDLLRMIFICCHPILPREARLALTLKTVCGFGVREVARAFLAQDETIEQRLVRAKRKIREARLPFEVPDSGELPARLDSVLETLYLLFNEGYGASQGEELVRRDLCEDAIRLATLVADHPAGDAPKTHALLALMLFQGSRLGARLDAQGEVLLLEDQDRSQWNAEMIHRGFFHLARSAAGEELSEYHLQASIAACHALAPSYAETDWARILADYDELLDRNHSPVIALNRAVALMMVEGPEAAIREVEKIRDLPPMRSYYLLPATLGEMYSRLGRVREASEYYRQALELVGTEAERRFLLKKLQIQGEKKNGSKKT
jgi:RNA polymerase sigma factor (sigma-70 family)